MCNKLVNIFKTDKPNVCFLGDIHGEFKSLQGLMKYTGFKDTLYISIACFLLFFKKNNTNNLSNSQSI